MFFDQLSPEHIRFIGEQKVFFTATAPAEGRINLSPKGMDTLRCLDEHTVAYLDVTGSGNETAAHLAHDGRLTLMLCSFSDKPLILRLYGRGRAVQPRSPEWPDLLAHFEPIPGMRQIIVLDVESVQTSCGFGVPVFADGEERPTLRRYGEKKSPEQLEAYWRQKNQTSIDGLATGLLADPA